MKTILAVTALLLGVHAQAAPIISLVPSSSVLAFNEAFTLDVLVSGVDAADPLLAFGFDVSTGAGLGYDGATVAPPFLDDSALFATTDVAGSVFPAISGDGILLSTLQFTAGTSAGFWEIGIGTSPGDFGVSEGLFTLQSTTDIAQSLRVEVVRGNEVPLPSTLLLLGLGLAAWRLTTTRRGAGRT